MMYRVSQFEGSSQNNIAKIAFRLPSARVVHNIFCGTFYVAFYWLNIYALGWVTRTACKASREEADDLPAPLSAT